jgi:hypothetical protein
MNDNSDFERMVGLGILGVVAVLAWPVWGVIIAGFEEFTWTTAASALIPLTFTVVLIVVGLRLPARASHAWHHGTHAVGERLHGSTHRHA